MIDRIPVIDLNRFETGDPTETKQAAQQLDQACREIGFLVITNHGVEASVQQALYDAGHAFFDMELDHKMTIRRPRDDQNRGYIPYGEETLARMHGGDTPPDYKEVFAIGPYDRPDDDYHSQDRSYPNFAPNLWPSGPATLEPAMKRYFDDIDGLSRRMAGYFALALDLPVDWFADKLDKHASQLRLLHYPAPTGELEAGQLRCGAHTDLGMMTILRNEAAAGGLQVRPRGGDWIDAPAIDDTFIINIGDLLMRWSNDRWVSTPHRVAVPEAEARARSRRMSIGFFTRPNYDAPISCIPTCTDAKHPAKYETTTVKEYNDARFARGAGAQEAA
ncbi:MAG: isopenicillin N synthase family oxygenase [Rhodospirillaceae bacterium]|nr:isopenicillin N synthase family oxygenase [Rhodospirillaceae bacterium]